MTILKNKNSFHLNYRNRNKTMIFIIMNLKKEILKYIIKILIKFMLMGMKN